MYQDMQTEHEMRQHLHILSKTPLVLSKGSWKKGQQKLVQEKQVRERSGDLTGEKDYVTSKETNVIL